MDDYGNSVSVDGSGNVYAVGDFHGDIYFTQDPDAVRFVSNGSRDAFLVTFDSLGNLRWARVWGSGADDKCLAVGADVPGNCYAGGTFRGKVDFDPGPGRIYGNTNGGNDAFLTKFLW